MIDYVLVTVKFQNKMEKDMELPAQIEIQKLCEMLLDTLQNAESSLFSDFTSVKLQHNRKIIDKGTLFDNKIWDGSILEVV